MAEFRPSELAGPQLWIERVTLKTRQGPTNGANVLFRSNVVLEPAQRGLGIDVESELVHG